MRATPSSRRLPAAGIAATGAALLCATATTPAAAAGMPQLDFNNPLTLGQVFWGAVIFLFLYLLLSRSALPRVGAVLADRRRRIDGDLDAARDARDEADRAVDDLRRARREAAAESSRIVDGVVEQARAEAAVRAAETSARLDREIAAAEAEVARARAEALAALPGVAADTAATLVERLSGRAPERELVERAVDRALADRALADRALSDRAA